MSFEEVMSVIEPGERLIAKDIVARVVDRYGATPSTVFGDVSRAVRSRRLKKSVDVVAVYWIPEGGPDG